MYVQPGDVVTLKAKVTSSEVTGDEPMITAEIVDAELALTTVYVKTRRIVDVVSYDFKVDDFVKHTISQPARTGRIRAIHRDVLWVEDANGRMQTWDKCDTER